MSHGAAGMAWMRVRVIHGAAGDESSGTALLPLLGLHKGEDA